ncbi:hypothetical protein L0P96_06555 [Anoxybacillus flavithermus]|jgi:hypothetical protein|nr:hypothetical protein BTDUT50_14875 [Neobacillus thermocopriae]
MHYYEGNSKELLHDVTRSPFYAIFTRHPVYERYLNERHPLEMVAYYKKKAEMFISQSVSSSD